MKKMLNLRVLLVPLLLLLSLSTLFSEVYDCSLYLSWDKAENYLIGSTVLYNNFIYSSNSNDNKGNCPADTSGTSGDWKCLGSCGNLIKKPTRFVLGLPSIRLRSRIHKAQVGMLVDSENHSISDMTVNVNIDEFSLGSGMTADWEIDEDGRVWVTFYVPERNCIRTMVNLTMTAEETISYFGSTASLRLLVSSDCPSAEPPPNPTPSPEPDVFLYLSPYNTRVEPETDFELKILVTSHMKALAAYEMELVYDPEYMIVDQIITNKGDRFLSGDNFKAIMPVPSRLNLSGFDVNGIGPGSNLELFKIYCHSGTKAGTSKIELNVTELLSASAEDLSGTSDIAQLIVTAETLGDLNLDGLVNIVDALLLAKYYVCLCHPSVIGINAPAEMMDVNRDGAANIIDALLIAQYYVGIITSFPGN